MMSSSAMPSSSATKFQVVPPSLETANRKLFLTPCVLLWLYAKARRGFVPSPPWRLMRLALLLGLGSPSGSAGLHVEPPSAEELRYSSPSCDRNTCSSVPFPANATAPSRSSVGPKPSLMETGADLRHVRPWSPDRRAAEKPEADSAQPRAAESIFGGSCQYGRTHRPRAGPIASTAPTASSWFAMTFGTPPSLDCSSTAAGLLQATPSSDCTYLIVPPGDHRVGMPRPLFAGLLQETLSE
mmetsp:Transcript_17681/g.42408  ORF Transcript_17681/g.42408 Transcript_17681/m.42408 type:complete len:241 (-) Transcript_17681:318-1040(-)